MPGLPVDEGYEIAAEITGVAEAQDGLAALAIDEVNGLDTVEYKVEIALRPPGFREELAFIEGLFRP